MSEELKPCPFCGSQAKLEDHRLIWAVRCVCGYCVLGERAPEPEFDMPDEYWSKFEKSAIEAWNRRAQPAEAEGVEVVAEVSLLNKQPVGVPMLREGGGWTLQAGEKLVRQSDHLAALSAVTAERDRLDMECGRLLEGKIQDAETIFVLEAERDQLRSEVEGLRKDAERYSHLKAAWDDDVLISYLDSNVHPSDWDRVIDAAMAAKEA